MRQERYAVQTSVSPSGAPQAALIGIVVSDRFEVFFDTLDTSRKAVNLAHDPRAAFVLGTADADSQRTVQFEGVADRPTGSDLKRLLRLYFARFPDGPARQDWPGLIYVRVTPTWIRYSNFATQPVQIMEFRPGGANDRFIQYPVRRPAVVSK